MGKVTWGADKTRGDQDLVGRRGDAFGEAI